MSGKLTPMKRYKSRLDEIRAVLSKDFEETSLNRVEPKSRSFFSQSYYDGGGMTKGVDSDFVMLFKSRKDRANRIARIPADEGLSLGLSFEYEGLPQDEAKVRGSVKYGGFLTYGDWMPASDLGASAKTFLIESAAAKSETEYADCFARNFMGKSLGLSRAFEDASGGLRAALKKLRKDSGLDAMMEESKVLDSLISKARSKAEKATAASREATEAARLRRELEEAERALRRRHAEECERVGLSELEAKSFELSNRIIETDKKLKADSAKASEAVPNFVKRRM